MPNSCDRRFHSAAAVKLTRRITLLLLMVMAAASSASCGATSNTSGSQPRGSAGAGAGGGSAGCPAGQAMCGSVCVDLTSNSANCGACNKACTTGETCGASACQCMSGLSMCGASCVDTKSDAQNCGGCGTVCPSGQVCAQGACSAAGCGALTQCGQSCVDPTTSVTNCGACNTACPAGESCSASACTCPTGQTSCGGTCLDTMTDGSNCGGCGKQCGGGASCTGGVCVGGGTGGASGAGGASGGAGAGGATNTAGTGGATGGTAGSAGTGGTGTCDAGTTTTTWASNCQSAPATTCVAPTGGNWIDPGSTTNDPLVCQSAHYAVHSPAGTITAQQCADATNTLETIVWPTMFGAPMFFPEPYCNSATKYKASIVIHSDYGLTGGGWGSGYMGMWVGPGATADHWGLAHEFTHAVQSTTKGLSCGTNYCGWIYESHANWRSHQLPEYHDPSTGNVHCSELLVNFPHLYLGSTRDRYCNWQFMEYLKDKYCYSAVNSIWTAAKTSNDPFTNIMSTQGWTISQLNDFFEEWAMHSITWDYKNPDGTDEGALYRKNYGAMTDRTGHAQGAPAGFRELRDTVLDPLDLPNRRFATPSSWAPQRWGYNIVRLFPDAGAKTVTVTFRGVVQTAAANTNFGTFSNQPATEPAPNSDWRWGLVAVDSGGKPRYSQIQRGSDGQLQFCLNTGDTQLWLVTMATPSVQQQILWDQMYYSVYRYPWMIQLAGAMPDGYQPSAPNPTTAGQRWANGGGWVANAATVASTVYVGPYATVLGGNISGTARIDDHAVVVSGTVSGTAVVNALSVISGGLTVSNSAHVGTVFQGPGTFESGQTVSGTGQILGDIELRGQGFNVASGVYYGFVDNTVTVDPKQGSARTAPVVEVTAAGPYTWRP